MNISPFRSLAIFFMSAAASLSYADHHGSALTEASFGAMPDGSEVKLFTLTNKSGMVAKVTEYGAILVSLTVADRNGTMADVTHGYDTLEGWLTNTSYLGATVGRFGNRIAHGTFELD
ncbi:MAG: galactose-1-epimerase, partial [Verrucomicrobiota bacterium]